MLADALQHVDQIDVGVGVVQLAGHQQALNHADMPGTDFLPAEHLVFTIHWKGGEGPVPEVSGVYHRNCIVAGPAFKV